MNIINPIVGGVLIGTSAVLLLFLLGRIAGISGILSSAVFDFDQVKKRKVNWQWLFILGLPLGASLAHAVTNISVPQAPSSNVFLTVLAGVMVGYGTRLGSGCTSGHGVCGIGRFSLRSVVATCVFMAVGILTVAMLRLLGVLL